MRDTKHFSDMIKERCIRPEWTHDVLKYPDKIEDKEDGTRHYLKKSEVMATDGFVLLSILTNSRRKK